MASAQVVPEAVAEYIASIISRRAIGICTGRTSGYGGQYCQNRVSGICTSGTRSSGEVYCQ